MRSIDESAFFQALEQSGFEVSAEQMVSFKKYMGLLLRWNKRTNLISRGDEKYLATRHFSESLSVLLACDIPPGARMVDVGSGAGFPAIPIKLMRPDLEFTLVESKRLKALFLRDVVQQLQLSSINILCQRAEALAEAGKFQHYFDFACCRAVASLDVEYAWLRPMLKSAGRFIAWKGGEVRGEIEKLLHRYQDIAVDVVMMSEKLVDPARDKKLIIVQRKLQTEENDRGGRESI